ncbi:MAG: J domain-containing protein [Granulosicoccus sp.]|nr:J domain-containing protein [Granulosicoccus sp.]
MDTRPDYYQLLHVQADAPGPVIKASYRAMMQKLRHHPDLGGDSSMAQVLNEAVDTLCDPARRALYDQQRQGTRIEEPAEPAQDSSSPADADAADDHQHPDRDPCRRADDESTPIQLPRKARCPFCNMLYASDAGRLDLYDTGNHCVRCKGPITPAGQPGGALSDELRRIYRHQHEATVSYWTCWPLPSPRFACLHDLSPVGCSIETTQSVKPGSTLLLDMNALVAICQVRHCRQSVTESRYAIGLEFLTLRIEAGPGAVFSVTA